MRRAKHASAVAVLLDAPLQLQTDASPTVDLVAQICLPRGCSTGTALTQTFINAARQGQQDHLRLRLNDAQTLDLGLSLGGFGLAYETP
ncbi:hypothetical protein CKO25_03515 [Thiocapsa imhoffii]|uniref:Uncharacterized protein n=1 Tax=Thiocapsa imhoffii TaxID=382777 RepID=A0A9X0WFH5_9GAMM|nr:invasion associated locus B family protein [Thiocapsa imhoffii]MBK1643741.1 hypothetical protein [Thiocapsa imhoffii]